MERGFQIPEKKHLRGVSEKEQRQYEHIKEEAEGKAAIAGASKRSLRAPC
jgi:hypothetical protein